MSDKESPSVMKKTSRMETAELIELVRQRACLWDRGDPLYRNRLEKERAWADIYRALDPSYDNLSRTERHEFGLVINRKWCNIRDCYKKYLNGTSRVNVSGRPYLYAGLLTFLDATYDSKDHIRKRKHNYETKDSTGEPEAEEPEWLSEVFVDMETPEGEPPDTHKKIKTEYPRTKDTLEPEDNIVSVLVNLIEKEEDEDRAFFKSITPTVKSLSDEDKFLFRIRVMKLLDELKRREKRLPPLKKEKVCRESDSE